MVSKSPNKQRKAAANASLHTQRKRLRARCLDPNYLNIRNVTIRVGDEVEIHRGDFGHPNSQKGDKGKRKRISRFAVQTKPNNSPCTARHLLRCKAVGLAPNHTVCNPPFGATQGKRSFTYK